MQRTIKGQLYEGKISKVLVQEIPNDSVVMLWHEDIDALTAESLIKKKVQAVINRKPSMSGKYEHRGVSKLLDAGIDVFDVAYWYGPEEECWNVEISLHGDQLFLIRDGYKILLAELSHYNNQHIEALQQKAKAAYQSLLTSFVTNTLTHASNEAQYIVDPIHVPNCLLQVKNRYVLIVARHGSYKQDLHALRRWLMLMNPVIIAVDGAADGLIELGLKPNIIIGDMDSVSIAALQCGASIICHSYMDGSSPGRERLLANNIEAEELQCLGTSEDAALLSSFWAEAEHLFLIGCRTGMKEFLEKNRKGMASTVLTRIQVGDKVTDLKGVHPLFASSKLSDQFQKVGHDLQEEWLELKTMIGRGYRMLLRKEAFRHD
ncbi:putative cytokinetic ring protein SteA [Alkalicoccobacillus porphyridii]|uniref:Uncharacterized protein n=1 Tax=Alkalicoccobacillus porphyridii TaxID=2597270 RepID=A0A553ZV62_9BACI|nr:putative cytokinetic ring protein SteA [Alkalicoccobacillus porphyridii]TSB45378.1 hypothetical protein FN960_16930 [Alkalicoccobacillus porphyridii]